MSAEASLSAIDEKTVAALESKAKALVSAAGQVSEGECHERACSALKEAAAILRDAAALCRRMSMIHPEREF